MTTMQLEIIPQMVKFERMLKDSFKRIGGITIGGGESGGGFPMGKMLGMAGVALGAVVAGNKILQDLLKSVRDELRKSSPALDGMRELLDKTYNLALKPIADLQALLLKPFLITMMQRLKTGFKAVQPILQDIARAGGAATPEQIKQIEDITRGMVSDFGALRGIMDRLTEPIGVGIVSFQKAIGAFEDINTSASVLGAAIKGTLGGVAQAITGNLSTEVLRDLGKNLRGEIELLPPLLKIQIRNATESLAVDFKPSTQSAIETIIENSKNNINVDASKSGQNLVDFIIEKAKASITGTKLSTTYTLVGKTLNLAGGATLTLGSVTSGESR